MFLPSGVMAQQIALLIHYHSQKNAGRSCNKSFVCHYSSHILVHEKDTASWLLNMEPVIVPMKEGSRVQHPISFEEVRATLCSAGLHSPGSELPAAVMVECPHREVGGKCTSYADLEKISQLCRNNGVALHMDGARLWEALAHYTECTTSSGSAVTAADLCGLFDSVYVSCYKGIGGMTGAVLMGDASFISEARVWLRRFGGNVFTLLPYAVSSYANYRKYVRWNIQPTDADNADGDAEIAKTETERHETETEAMAAVAGALPIPYSMKARLQRMQEVVVLLTTELSALSNSLIAASTGTDNGAARFQQQEHQDHPDHQHHQHHHRCANYVRFDPPVPQVCLIHVYIRSSVQQAMAAQEVSRSETGVVCFARLRPAAAVVPLQVPEGGLPVQEECFFEFNMVGN